jgi:hypothetical protein
MKVAAYQAPLAACADARVLSLVRQQVDRCETPGVALLCCPEALLGGLDLVIADIDILDLGHQSSSVLVKVLRERMA